ncbi:MAG: ATP-binding protein [Candidatus Dojkabacteria bacterium]|nr:MAG: ATP-binding protein [Candidatus Dojkabacteria bacterium]
MSQNELTELVDELRTLPTEVEWVEFKVNNENPDEIGEYISALANSSCILDKPYGYLVFGIENETHAVIGTLFDPRARKVNGQEIESWLLTFLDPHTDLEIIPGLYKGKKVVVIKISAALNIPIKFKGEDYIRVGSYKKRLKDFPEKARKIWMKDGKAFEDLIAIEGVDRATLLELIDMDSYFRLMKINVPESNDYKIEQFILKKLIYKNENSYSITNLCALLLAKDITGFTKLSRKAVRVIIYEGKDKAKTIREQVGKKGFAAGFEGLIDFINNQLPSNEEIEKAFRKEVRMYPEIAIREIVANALIHQDLTITGTSPMIEIYEDRIEISNPGSPLIDTLRFIDSPPISRNEKLASMMKRMYICEERGSGIDKAIKAAEEYQLPAPLFRKDDNFTRVVLFAPRSLRQMDSKDKIRACYQHCCLQHIVNGFMTNTSLRERFGIKDENYSTISRVIKETLEEGLIKDYDPQNKSRKNSRYIPYYV